MRNITVLIGEGDGQLRELLTDLIGLALEDECNLKMFATFVTDELSMLARSHNVDLFVLIVNNLFFSGGEASSESRIEKGLQFVTHLKNEFHKPIIALAGFPHYPEYADEIISAGADRFYRLPFKMDDFAESVRECLADALDPC